MDNKEDRQALEVKMRELEAIVNKLESDVSLDESVKLFEKGLGLTKACIDELNKTHDEIAALKKQLDTILISVPGGEDER